MRVKQVHHRKQKFPGQWVGVLPSVSNARHDVFQLRELGAEMAKTRRRHGRGFRLRKPHSDFDTPLRAEFQGLAEIRKKTLLRAIFVFGVRLMRAKKKKGKKREFL